MICSTKRRTRSLWEKMRADHREGGRGEEREWEKEGEREWDCCESCPHCPSVVVFNCSHLKSSRGRPSQPEEESRACRGEKEVTGILRMKMLWKSWCTACWWCWRRWSWRQWWWWCWRQSQLTLQPARSMKHHERTRKTAIHSICVVNDTDFSF